MRGQITETQVFRDREVRTKRQFLMHHRNAELPRDEWIGWLDGLAGKLDFSVVRRVNSARILPSVLLPAPFSPMSAWQLPRSTSKLTPSSASTPGKAFGDTVESEEGHFYWPQDA